jgi:hypothetical protein
MLVEHKGSEVDNESLYSTDKSMRLKDTSKGSLTIVMFGVEDPCFWAKGLYQCGRILLGHRFSSYQLALIGAGPSPRHNCSLLSIL